MDTTGKFHERVCDSRWQDCYYCSSREEVVSSKSNTLFAISIVTLLYRLVQGRSNYRWLSRQRLSIYLHTSTKLHFNLHSVLVLLLPSFMFFCNNLFSWFGLIRLPSAIRNHVQSKDSTVIVHFLILRQFPSLSGHYRRSL